MKAFLYWLVAAAVGVVVAGILPPYLGTLATTAELTAILAGVTVFALGGLIAEVCGRRRCEFDILLHATALGNSVRNLWEEVRKVREMQQRFTAAPTAGIEAIDQDVRMLKNLITQLASNNTEIEQNFGEHLSGEMADEATPISTALRQVIPIKFTEMLEDAITNDRFELYQQQIVSLPQRKLQFYECLPRLRTAEGEIFDPRPFLNEVGGHPIFSPALDNILLMQTAHYVKRMNRCQQLVGYFMPIAGASLRDPEFFSDFIAFFISNSDLAGVLNFSIIQHDAYRLPQEVDAALTRLASFGFRFCLDHTVNFDLFVSDLSAKGFRYVKVDASVLLASLQHKEKPRALKRMLDRGAIDLIVTGITNEVTLLELLDYAVDFGQGELFGKPKVAYYQ